MHSGVCERKNKFLITFHHSEFDANPWDLSAAGHWCFLCGEFLQDPAVQWSGGDGQRIYLHANCVIEWMPGLMRDALAIRYANHPCGIR